MVARQMVARQMAARQMVARQMVARQMAHCCWHPAVPRGLGPPPVAPYSCAGLTSTLYMPY